MRKGIALIDSGYAKETSMIIEITPDVVITKDNRTEEKIISMRLMKKIN